MILPEGTIPAPPHATEEQPNQDQDFALSRESKSGDRKRSGDIQPFSPSNSDSEHYNPHSLSQGSYLSEPLLPFRDVKDDVERGCPPHESSRVLQQEVPPVSEKRPRLWTRRYKLVLSLAGGVAAWLILVGSWATVKDTLERKVERHANHAPSSMHSHWEDEKWGDGVPVECADFSTAEWERFGSGRKDGEEGRVSTNVSFSIPIKALDTFVHLFGPGAVGDIFVGTFDGDDPVVYEEDKTGITGSTNDQAITRQGEYVRVVVEPVVPIDLGKEIRTSWGYEMLLASRVCLMLKQEEVGSQTESTVIEKTRLSAESVSPNPDEERDEKRNAMGVGIYTRRPERQEPHGRKRPALSFRLHISLPRVVDSQSESQIRSVGLASALVSGGLEKSASFRSAEHLKWPLSHSPKNRVRLLDIHNGVGTTYFSNLKEAHLGEAFLVLGVGSVEFDRTRAESIRIKTGSGGVSGQVDVSDSLDINCPVGNINLDLGFAAVPSYNIHPGKSPFEPSSNAFSADYKGHCHSPISVKMKSGSGHIDVRHISWAEPCRRLSQSITAEVGSVEVQAHPLYQGPFNLRTSVGSINLRVPETSPDPTGQGRSRHFSVNKDDHLGSRRWWGDVTWSKATAAAAGVGLARTRRNGEQYIVADGDAESPREDERYLVRDRSEEKEREELASMADSPEAGMTVESSVGSISLIF